MGTSAKISDIKDCMCLNFIPARMAFQDDTRPHGVRMRLQCMMCGRASEGDTPKEAVENWNTENAAN
jgi:hypothetical protein